MLVGLSVCVFAVFVCLCGVCVVWVCVCYVCGWRDSLFVVLIVGFVLACLFVGVFLWWCGGGCLCVG